MTYWKKTLRLDRAEKSKMLFQWMDGPLVQAMRGKSCQLRSLVQASFVGWAHLVWLAVYLPSVVSS